MIDLTQFQDLLPVEGEYVTPKNVNVGEIQNRLAINELNQKLGELQDLLVNTDENFCSDQFFSAYNKKETKTLIDEINALGASLGDRFKYINEDKNNFVIEINDTHDKVYRGQLFKEEIASYERNVFGDFIIEGLHVDLSEQNNEEPDELIFQGTQEYIQQQIKENRNNLKSTWYRDSVNNLEMNGIVPIDSTLVGSMSTINDLDILSRKFPSNEHFLAQKNLEFTVRSGKLFSDGYYFFIDKDTKLKFIDVYPKFGDGESVSGLTFNSIGSNSEKKRYEILNGTERQQYLVEENVTLNLVNADVNLDSLKIIVNTFNTTSKTISSGIVDNVECNIYTFSAKVFFSSFMGRNFDSISSVSGKITLYIDNTNTYCTLEGNGSDVVLNIDSSIGTWYNIESNGYGNILSFGDTDVSDLSSVGITIEQDILTIQVSYLDVLDTDISLVGSTDIKYPTIDAIYVKSIFVTNSPTYNNTKQYAVGESVSFGGNIYTLRESVLVGVDPSESTNWEFVEAEDLSEKINGGTRIPIFSYIRGSSEKQGNDFVYKEPESFDPEYGLLVFKMYREGDLIQIQTPNRIEQQSFLDVTNLYDRLRVIQYNLSKLSSVLEKNSNDEGLKRNMITYDFGDLTYRDFGLEATIGIEHCDITDGTLEPKVNWNLEKLEFDTERLRLDVSSTTEEIVQDKYTGNEYVNKYGVETPPFTTIKTFPKEVNWIANTIDIYTAMSNSEYNEVKSNAIINTNLSKTDEYRTDVTLRESSFETSSLLSTSSSSNISWTNSWFWWSMTTTITTTTTDRYLDSFYTGNFRLVKMKDNSALYRYSYNIRIIAEQYSFDYNEDILVYIDNKFHSVIKGNISGSVDETITITDIRQRLNRKHIITLVGRNSKIFADGSIDLNAYMKTRYFNTTVRTETKTTTSVLRRVDPIAQTFFVKDDFHLDSIDVIFDIESSSGAEIAPGSNFTLPENVIILITETSAGVPDVERIVAQQEIKIGTSMNNASWHNIQFEEKPLLKAEKVYSFMLLTTATTQGRTKALLNDTFESKRILVRIANLGDRTLRESGYDIIVNEQAYIDGVVLTSSNETTWSVDQKMDLAFKIKSCEFSNSKTYTASNTINYTDITDFMFVKESSESSDGTNVSYSVSFTDDNLNVTTFSQTDVNVGKTFSNKLNLTEIEGSVDLSTTNTLITPYEKENIDVLIGSVVENCTYITRNLEMYEDDGRLRVSFDVNDNFDSSLVKVYYTTERVISATTSWNQLTDFSLGYKENEVIYTDTTSRSFAGILHIRIDLNVDINSPSIRSKLQNIRVYTII